MTSSEVVSFDVFDTLVTRNVYEPRHVFLLWAMRVLHLSGDCPASSEVYTLAKKRIIAELNARAKTTKEDVGLDEIYRELDLSRCLPIGKDMAKQLELKAESDCIIASEYECAQYKAIKASTKLLISDMYLSRDFISELLLRQGLEVDRRDLYVSSEHGKTKSSGSLFQYIQSNRGLVYSEWKHFGDNNVSDYSVPKRLGINARKTRGYTKEFGGELIWGSSLRFKLSSFFSDYSRFVRGFGVGIYDEKHSAENYLRISRLASASRYVKRGVCQKSGRHALSDFSAYICGPLVSAFCIWLLNRALANGIQHLFFVARNGYILYKVCEAIKGKFYPRIKCTYIYGSRSSWYLCAQDEIDEIFVKNLSFRYANFSFVDVLCALDVPGSDLVAIKSILEKDSNGLDFYSRDKEDVESCFYSLLKSEAKKIVDEHFENHRRGAISYFQEVGFFESCSIGVVDIGWMMSSHNALYQMTKEKRPQGFIGFYFGVRENHLPVDDKTPFEAFVSEKSRHENLFRLGPTMILEDLITAAPHGTCRHYRSEGRDGAVALAHARNKSYTESHQVIHKTIFEYAKNIGKFNIDDDLLELKDYLLERYLAFCCGPSFSDAAAVGELMANPATSHGLRSEKKLATKLSLKELMGYSYSAFVGNRDIDVQWVWLEGSIARSSFAVRVVGSALLWVDRKLVSCARVLKSVALSGV